MCNQIEPYPCSITVGKVCSMRPVCMCVIEEISLFPRKVGNKRRLKVLEASPAVCFWGFIASRKLLEVALEAFLLDGRSTVTVAC